LAFSKKRKEEILAQYKEWMSSSRAMVITEYNGMTMSELDDLRAKLREIGGEYHVIKNTLGSIAAKDAGMETPQGFFEGSTAIGFGFEDAPGIAKAIVDYTKSSEFVKIKGGYLGQSSVSENQIKALAELPPLPVMRAQLLGTILAPASQLVRTLAEPGRQIAAVVKAFSEAEPVSANG